MVEAVQYCIDNNLETGFDGSRLKIYSINSNQYYIDEYDNVESIVEQSDIKWITIE